jgi:hypothetical protein
MLKTILMAGALLALSLTAAQAHDNRSSGLLGLNANVGNLLGVHATVGSSRDGLLAVNANVGDQSRHAGGLLDVRAGVGQRNSLVDAHVEAGGNRARCDFCGHDGGVGHSGW